MNKLNVLVTGATGYIGRHLVTQLMEHNCMVQALVPPGERCNFDARVRVITGDICEPVQLSGEIQCIYHCAGIIYDEQHMWKVNVEGTRRMTELAMAKSCRLIHLSSAGVIGKHPPGIVDETSACSPGNIYEKSKLEAENVVVEAIKHGLQAQILRPTIVFGGMDRIPERDSFLQLLKAMKSGMYLQIGHGIYNLIHVNEVARAMMLLNNEKLDNGGAFFINTPITYEEIYHIVAELCNRDDTPRRIPYSVAWSAALCLSLWTIITGKSSPLTFTRLNALSNKTIFSQQRLEQITNFKPLINVKKYIEEAYREYAQRDLL